MGEAYGPRRMASVPVPMTILFRLWQVWALGLALMASLAHLSGEAALWCILGAVLEIVCRMESRRP